MVTKNYISIDTLIPPPNNNTSPIRFIDEMKSNLEMEGTAHRIAKTADRRHIPLIELRKHLIGDIYPLIELPKPLIDDTYPLIELRGNTDRRHIFAHRIARTSDWRCASAHRIARTADKRHLSAHRHAKTADRRHISAHRFARNH